MQRLQVFISSPGDVLPERRRAALVIEKLAKDYVRFFDIHPYLWETEPMLASGHFQDAIVPPGEADIVILILWARLGTSLPSSKYRGIDGRTPVTGTEWEFENALAAFGERKLPHCLVYKKTATPRAEYSSDSDLEDLRRQLHRFEAFWRRHFLDRGEFIAAFSQFADLDTFELKLESDLRSLIERRVAGSADKENRQPTWLKGSPFRGLDAYHFEDRPIFFGRTAAANKAVEQLVQNAERGLPFLLLLGASGTGKSSLSQAGVLPALAVRGVVPEVGEWRRAVVRPAGHPEGPFVALANALTRDDALPELLKGQDVSSLARHLENAAADPAFPLAAALGIREQAARDIGDLLSFETVRLALIVDQLEELFTLGGVTFNQRSKFILCLKGLMNCGRVFVVATMRSDYWHRATEIPLLVELAQGLGRFDILPPTQAEITELIRRPAEVAGLSFETDPRIEIRLDAMLAAESSREPGALPLLSFLLDAIYLQDIHLGRGTVLTYKTMHKLGGFQGALAKRAEVIFAGLSPDVQAAFPAVMRALVTVSRSGAEPTARPVSMSRFPENGAERAFIAAFLDPQVRLLVADGDGTGARLRVAHEALITHWDRAKRQIEQDHDDLRTRAMVEEAETNWKLAKSSDRRGYLLRDPQLANAIDLSRRWPNGLNESTHVFIMMSRQKARLRQRAVAMAAAIFAGAALLAGWQYFEAKSSPKRRG